jgi:hypothetical protein
MVRVRDSDPDSIRPRIQEGQMAPKIRGGGGTEKFYVLKTGLRIRITIMWIRIQLFHLNADPGPAFCFNTDSDPH